MSDWEENRENYYALWIAIVSPIELSIEEAFAVLAGQKEFPVEQEPTAALTEEIAARIQDNTLVYRRLERRHRVSRETIQKIVREMRKANHGKTNKNGIKAGGRESDRYDCCGNF